jgi:aspartate aminotransferase-like enzyme
VSQKLKEIFQTKNEVLTFACSGTGVMEAAVCGLLSPGDEVLVIQGGKFGKRWAEICRAFSIKVSLFNVKPGTAPRANEVRNTLAQNPHLKAVFTTLCETSTGTVYDIKALGEITKNHSALLVVDAISGLLSDNLATDDWNVDVALSGSQKGLMLPPGLGFITLSPKAWAVAKQAQLPKYYWDLIKARESLKEGQTPYTPSISLILGLQASLQVILKDGLSKILTQRAKIARAVRKAIRALGLKIFSSSPSNGVTAIAVPPNLDCQKLLKICREEYGIIFAGGQDELKGKLFRIAHMGGVGEAELIQALGVLELALLKLGFKFSLGAGVKHYLREIG